VLINLVGTSFEVIVLEPSDYSLKYVYTATLGKLLDSIIGISVELSPKQADFATNDFIHQFINSQTVYFADTKK